MPREARLKFERVIQRLSTLQSLACRARVVKDGSDNRGVGGVARVLEERITAGRYAQHSQVFLLVKGSVSSEFPPLSMTTAVVAPPLGAEKAAFRCW